MTIILGGDRTITGQERVVVNLETYRGDTNNPISFICSKATIDNPISNVAIAFVKDGIERHRLDVSGGDIAINSFGTFTLNQYILDLPGYTYKYDIQITLQNGLIQSPIYGHWKIKEDQTR